MKTNDDRTSKKDRLCRAITPPNIAFFSTLDTIQCQPTPTMPIFHQTKTHLSPTKRHLISLFFFHHKQDQVPIDP